MNLASERRQSYPQLLRERGAFTLVELLVVISLIGILASLLLGSIGRAKVAADTAICRSNLRQFGIASRMYLDDFHCYPAARNPLDPLFLFEPYVNARIPGSDSGKYQPGRSVWVCPSYQRLGLATDRARYAYSYGYNYQGAVSGPPGGLGLAWTGATIDSGDPYPPVREEEVLVPVDMIEFGDAALGLDLAVLADAGSTVAPVAGTCVLGYGVNGAWANYDILAGLTDEPPAQPLYSFQANGSYDALITQLYRRRHGGRWNIGFCDGHVESLRPQDVFDTTKDEQMRRWNRDHQPHNR